MNRFPPIVSRLIPRLATDHVGELVATRDALVRSLRTVGLDLHDLAAACSTSSSLMTTSYGQTSWTSQSPSFGDMARGCRDLDHGQLSPRERAFVADMCSRGFRFTPSVKQSTWLGSIFDRLSERAAA